jgi:hypothetical protein
MITLIESVYLAAVLLFAVYGKLIGAVSALHRWA